MSVENFDILLTRPAQARVIDSPSGQSPAPEPLDLDIQGLVSRYHELLRHPKLEKEDLVRLGKELFAGLMSGYTGRLFDRSLGIAKAEEAVLRIRLQIESPGLGRLPWEILYSQYDGGFLCAEKDFTISRFLPVPHPVEAMRIGLPLRILVVASSPMNLPRLAFEREKAVLEDALAKSIATSGVRLEFEQDARREQLLSRLQHERYHILHFIGHGGWRNDEGIIALMEPNGHADRVSGETFSGILSACKSLRLVTLNACDTAHEDSATGFSGVASQLIAHGIPAVIAMSDSIRDATAIVFVKHLYGNLARGDSIDTALTHTRQQLHLDHSENPGAFSIPVLYLHAPDGELFRIVNSRKKRLARVSQQISRLNETSTALSEWKLLHDHLQNLSRDVDDIYQMALSPGKSVVVQFAWDRFEGYLEDYLIPFAADQIRYAGRRYQVTEEGPSGEDWIVLTLQHVEDIDHLISAGDAAGIKETAGELRTLLYRHMTICNTRMSDLLEQTNLLYAEARDILLSVQAEEAGLKHPTLDWVAIERDLAELEDHSARILEWMDFHDLFDQLQNEYSTFFANAILEKSLGAIAKSWLELRDSQISKLLEQAKQITKIGQAYVELSNGSVLGDRWIVDLKRKSDHLTNLVTQEKDLNRARDSISNLNRAVGRQYLLIDQNIKNELQMFAMRSVALQRSVGLQARAVA